MLLKTRVRAISLVCQPVRLSRRVRPSHDQLDRTNIHINFGTIMTLIVTLYCKPIQLHPSSNQLSPHALTHSTRSRARATSSAQPKSAVDCTCTTERSKRMRTALKQINLKYRSHAYKSLGTASWEVTDNKINLLAICY